MDEDSENEMCSQRRSGRSCIVGGAISVLQKFQTALSLLEIGKLIRLDTDIPKKVIEEMIISIANTVFS